MVHNLSDLIHSRRSHQHPIPFRFKQANSKEVKVQEKHFGLKCFYHRQKSDKQPVVACVLLYAVLKFFARNLQKYSKHTKHLSCHSSFASFWLFINLNSRATSLSHLIYNVNVASFQQVV